MMREQNRSPFMHRCPHCREIIHRGAMICPMCSQPTGWSSGIALWKVVIAAAVIGFAIFAATHARAQSRETPIYDKDGRYNGSVFDYGRTQTYTDRNGQFNGSAVNNGNGTTSFFNRNGQFSGSAGSSIDRAFNFNKR